MPKVGVISSPRTGDILRHGVGSRVHGSLPGEFSSGLVNIEAANCPSDSDWGCFRGCAISSSLGAPF